MRVIAGTLGGRIFEAPKGHRTHPMGDKIRGALFNALGDITGLTVLDAFAGSGGISIEAISRGAKSAIALDDDANAYETLKQNVSSLGIESQMEVVRANAKSWSNRHPNDRYDLVVCDPPYDDIQFRTVEKLFKHVTEGGILVLSMPPGARIIVGKEFEYLSTKPYGDATLAFYRRIS
jgi:16S rRNA (guanine966-N2)-methyltransferase